MVIIIILDQFVWAKSIHLFSMYKTVG